jgi:uncharacterized YccA/Bax inhibitor family protein
MSRNPILNDRAFELPGSGGTSLRERPSPADEWDSAQLAGSGQAAAQDAVFGRTQPSIPSGPTGPISITERTMSLGGVASATLLMFAFVLLGGLWGWSQVTERPNPFAAPGEPDVFVELNSPGLLFGALALGFILAIVTAFRPTIARFTAIPYSLIQGALLGMISHLYDAQFDGIVLQAVVATLGVFLAMLALYGLRILRATPKFVKGVVAATFSIMLMYIGAILYNVFTGNTVSFLHDASAFGIGLSVVIVIVAALNLILDFDFIERGTQNHLPRHMDWYAAFGLVVTLIWLYLEMLRLLARLRQ